MSPLMPTDIADTLPGIGTQDGKGEDAIARVKFFTPWSDWTWYVLEYDSGDKTAFGLVQGFEEELGYFSLDELESLRGPGGLRVERDRYFTPTPLKEVRR